MGLLAAAGITAPAALAAGDEAPAPAAPTLPEGGSAATEILTPAPDVAETTTPDPVGAHFGWGKLEPDVVFAEGSSFPRGAELDRSGAKIRVTFQSILGSDLSDPGSPIPPSSLECTWDEADLDGNPCDFSQGDGPVDGGRVVLLPDSTFTIELVAPPTKGQVLLPSAADRVITGYTDGDSEGPLEAVFQAPGAYRTIGVTLADARGSAVAGATFELCTVANETCAPSTASGELAAAGPLVVSAVSSPAGQLTFPGRYLAGTYQIRQTASADGSPFSTAPLSLVLAAAGSPSDTTAPVLLAVALPTGTSGPAPVAAPNGAPATTGTGAPTTAGTGTPTTVVPSTTAAAVASSSAPARAAARLASTGAEPLPILALGTGLVLAGGAVTLAAARRRTR